MSKKTLAALEKAAMRWHRVFQWASENPDPTGKLFRAEAACDKACAAHAKSVKKKTKT